MNGGARDFVQPLNNAQPESWDEFNSRDLLILDSNRRFELTKGKRPFSLRVRVVEVKNQKKRLQK